MFIHETQKRVRYGETDQMGFVYYGNYPLLYEIGRTEALRSIGSSYKKLEDSGVMMPVISMNIAYKKPARYDDLLTIRTIIEKIPESRMIFKYEIYNEAGDLLNIGETTLIFMSSESNRPQRAPKWLTELFIKALEQ